MTTSRGSADDHPLILHFGHEELVVRRRYEVASIINDFLIALWFVVGSVFFLFDSLATAGTVLFLLGSLQFAARPAIRLRRRLHLRRISAGSPAETAADF